MKKGDERREREEEEKDRKRKKEREHITLFGFFLDIQWTCCFPLAV